MTTSSGLAAVRQRVNLYIWKSNWGMNMYILFQNERIIYGLKVMNTRKTKFSYYNTGSGENLSIHVSQKRK